MDKKTLMEAFWKIADKESFTPTKTDIYMPRLAKGQYRSVIARGNYGEKSVAAILRASPHEDYQVIAHNFKKYEEAVKRVESPKPEFRRWKRRCATFSTPIIPPEVIKSGKDGELFFMIQFLAPSFGVSERLLPNYPKSNPEQKKSVAKIYWDTRRVLDYLYLGPGSPKDSLDYFIRRLRQFVDAITEAKADDKFISGKLESKAFGFILKHICDMDETRYSFSHFTNTDIIKCGETHYIIDATIEERPQMYDAAFWIWGLTMYAYDIPPKEWLEEMERWMNVFLRGCSYYISALKLSVCLVERMLGTLLVDLPLRHSPFDKLDDKAVAKEAKLAQAVIKYLCASFP